MPRRVHASVVLILLVSSEALHDVFETIHDPQVLLKGLMVHRADLVLLLFNVEHFLAESLLDLLYVTLILLRKQLIFSDLLIKELD